MNAFQLNTPDNVYVDLNVSESHYIVTSPDRTVLKNRILADRLVSNGVLFIDNGDGSYLDVIKQIHAENGIEDLMILTLDSRLDVIESLRNNKTVYIHVGSYSLEKLNGFLCAMSDFFIKEKSCQDSGIVSSVFFNNITVMNSDYLGLFIDKTVHNGYKSNNIFFFEDHFGDNNEIILGNSGRLLVQDIQNIRKVSQLLSNNEIVNALSEIEKDDNACIYYDHRSEDAKLKIFS